MKSAQFAHPNVYAPDSGWQHRPERVRFAPTSRSHPHRPFTITDATTAGVDVIAIEGEFDAAAVPQLEETVGRVLDAGRTELVVDLSATDFLDSLALAALVHCSRRMREQGSTLVVVATASHQPVTKFDLSGTRQFFHLCETVDDAIALLASYEEESDDADTAGHNGDASVVLRLYVLGRSQRAVSAIAGLDEMRTLHLPRDVSIDVVDLAEDPDRAEQERILATPLLMRVSPTPVRRIVGDLSDVPEVLRALDLPREGSAA